ncbi:MAG: SGNH/GDSL hydrolase family protein [Candidatus Zixiibacteriota bacterium]
MKSIFALFAICLTLSILEITARVTESRLSKDTPEIFENPGWQPRFFNSFLGWHESDPDLLWKFRKNIDNPLIKTNSRGLLGEEIPAGKEENVFRILLLGDSSPVGLGLKSREQVFNEILGYLLNMQFHGNRKFEVINAAVSGYTSEQIWRFLRQKGWELQPDLIILYCGNNDASISGQFQDFDLFERQRFKFIRRLLSHSALYRFLKNLILSPGKSDASNPYQLTLRVPPERFAENLGNIINQCHEHNCPLIIAKPPVPLLWPAGLQFRALAHISDKEGELIFPDEMRLLLGRPLKYCVSQEMFRKLYGQGDIFTQTVYSSAHNDALPSDSMMAYYSDQYDRNPEDPVCINNLGVLYWENNDYIGADSLLRYARYFYIKQHDDTADCGMIAAGSPFLFNIGINLLSMQGGDSGLTDTSSFIYKHLDSACQADYFSLRIKRSYQRIIDSLSSSENVYAVDLPGLFAKSNNETLFIDHCHPTAEGHRLIASAILETIINNQIIK